MLAENYIKAMLANYAYKEGARYGGIDNMLAVCHVIRNRMDNGWYGGDWLAALDNAPEVAANEPGEDEEMPTPPINLRDVATRRFLDKVDYVFDGSAPDLMTDGALYYGDLKRPRRLWFVQNITANLDEHPHVATVGPVWFFR